MHQGDRRYLHPEIAAHPAQGSSAVAGLHEGKGEARGAPPYLFSFEFRTAGYPTSCLAFRNTTAGRVTTSVHECLIDERLEHLAVIGAYRARRLCHIDTDDLFLGIYPEKSAGVTSPHELARGAGHAGNPVVLAYCKAKAECIARRSQQKLTRLERCCDARAEMV